MFHFLARNIIFTILCIALSNVAMAGLSGTIPIEWFDTINTGNSTTTSTAPFLEAFYGQTSMSNTSTSPYCPDGEGRYVGGYNTSDFNVNSTYYTYACKKVGYTIALRNSGQELTFLYTVHDATTPDYTSTGVYSSSGRTSSSKLSSGNTVLTSLPAPRYTLTYNATANGGTVSPTTAKGGNLTGFYSGSTQCVDANGKITSAGITNGINITANTDWNAQFESSTRVTLPTPTKSNHVFKGWYTAASGGTKRGDAGDSYDITANETLYAQWKIHCNSGTYLPKNSSTCSPCPAVTSGTGYWCPGGDFDPSTTSDQGKNSCVSGYPWSNQNNADISTCYVNMYFYPGTGASFNGSTSSYYTADNIRASIRSNYKTGSGNDAFLYVSGTDGHHTLNSRFLTNGNSAPTRPNYTFDGWLWQKYDGNVTQSDCDEGNLDLYTDDCTAASCNYRGCTPNTPGTCPENFTYGGGLCIPNSKMYGPIDENTTIYSGSQRNFYAKWIPDLYTITYNANGGSCTPSTQTNLLSVQPSTFTTSNADITVTTDGHGTYILNGTASADARVYIPINAITIPSSGMVAMNNNQAFTSSEVLFQFYDLDDATHPQRGGYQANELNRYINFTSAAAIANQTANRLSIWVKNGTTVTDLKFTPALYTDGRSTPGDFVFNSIYGHTDGCQPVMYNIDSSDITLPTPSKTGHTFAGWCENSGLTVGCELNKTVTHGSTGDKTYWAKWTANNYEITMKRSDGGTDYALDGNNQQIKVYTTYGVNAYKDNPRQVELDTLGNNKLDVPANPLQLTLTYDLAYSGAPAAVSIPLDRLFSGFYSAPETDPNATQYVFPTGIITPDGLDAAKTVANNTTSWIAHWGNAQVSGLPTNPTREGHTFIGWLNDNTGNSIQNGNYISQNTNVSAQWAACLPYGYEDTWDLSGKHISGITSVTDDNKCKYTVTCVPGYETSTGATSYEVPAATAGTTATAEQITACIPSIYVFNLSLNTEDTNASFTNNIDTIYEKINNGWYTDNTATTAISNQNKVLATRTGHTFGGYYRCDGVTGNLDFGDPGCEQIITSDGELHNLAPTNLTDTPGTLYAKWTVDVYQIRYERDGGTCSGTDDPECGPSTYTIEDTVVLEDPVKTGHDFGGWCKYTSVPAADTVCETPSINPQASATETIAAIVAGNETGARWFYANWGQHPYPVTYNCGTGDGNPPQNITQLFGDEFTLANTDGANCSKTGHHFTGWACKYLDGDEGAPHTDLTAGDTYDLPYPATCEAKWEANDIYLSWNKGPNTATITAGGSTFCKYGTPNDITVQQVSRPGYTFNGWDIQRD